MPSLSKASQPEAEADCGSTAASSTVDLLIDGHQGLCVQVLELAASRLPGLLGATSTAACGHAAPPSTGCGLPMPDTRHDCCIISLGLSFFCSCGPS